MADTDQPSPFEKLALLDLLTHAHAQADAYIETIGDAAALAANQVQDVRLEYLEKGPTVTLTDAFIDLLLAVAIEEGLEDILVAVTKNLLTRVISTREGFLRVAGRTEYGNVLAKVYEANLKDIKTFSARLQPKFEKLADKAFAAALKREGGATELYTEWPFAIVETGTKIVSHTAAQSLGLKTNYTRLGVEDSPGVAVLDNAQVFVLRHKTFHRIIFEEMRNLLLIVPLSRENFDLLIKTVQPYTTPLSGPKLKLTLTEIKQHYKQFFEACIWSRILDPRPAIKSAEETKRLLGSPPIGAPPYLQDQPQPKRDPSLVPMGPKDISAGRSAYLDVGDRGLDLTEYLLKHIVNPRNGRPFGQNLAPPPPPSMAPQTRRPLPPGIAPPPRQSRQPQLSYFNKRDDDTQALKNLLDYFDKIRTKTDQLEARLPPEGRSIWHPPHGAEQPRAPESPGRYVEGAT